jgi:hypothetical protein
MTKIEIPFLSEITSRTTIQEISQKLDQLEKQIIGNVPWPEYSYNPGVKFAIAHSEGHILLKYYVSEREVKAVYSRPNDPVYRDSCVEFFVQFADDPNYYNLEFNSHGTCLMGYGPGRGNRNRLPEHVIGQIQSMSIIQQRQVSSPDINWQLTLLIPHEVFCYRPIRELHGVNARANFYKCGDDLSQPHFVTWNHISAPKPDFHLPEFFGEIHFL